MVVVFVPCLLSTNNVEVDGVDRRPLTPMKTTTSSLAFLRKSRLRNTHGARGAGSTYGGKTSLGFTSGTGSHYC
jgi:hypothetical protein